MKRLWMMGAVWVCLNGCGDGDLMSEPGAEGSLALSLSSSAGGVEYRLRDGHFTLEGPVQRELTTGDEPTLVLELPAGAYRLTLQPGYHLARADDPLGAEVPARLVSANPASVMVNPGQTAKLTLRFELGAAEPALEGGSLAIALAVDASDAGLSHDAGLACEGSLALSELDYEQAGTDEAEFIEVLNPSRCPAALTGVTLELVNGGDGKVYSRYDLGSTAPALAPGARLVLGDSAILAALPAGTPTIALNGSGLQNGPDGVRLMRAEVLVDAMTYEGDVPGFATTPSPADEGEGALSRCPEAASGSFRLAPPTPGAANACASP